MTVMKKLVLFLSMLLLISSSAMADDVLTLTIKHPIHGFQDNVMTIESALDGTLRLEVTAVGQVYRTITQQITAGETELHWNGLALYDEPLPDAAYRITAKLETENGNIIQTAATVKADRCGQALLYALPTDRTLYLDDPKGSWFLQAELSRKG